MVADLVLLVDIQEDIGSFLLYLLPEEEYCGHSKS